MLVFLDAPAGHPRQNALYSCRAPTTRPERGFAADGFRLMFWGAFGFAFLVPAVPHQHQGLGAAPSVCSGIWDSLLRENRG